MDLKLTGRVALITGSGQGIGREIGLSFAREGAAVAFHYNRSAAAAEDAAREAQALGVHAVAVGADITDGAQVDRLVSEVEAALGPVDVLVNNAALVKQQRFLDSTPQDWQPQFGATVFGMMAVSQRVLRGMAERGRGSIVNLTGDSGRVGESGLVVTAAARAAAIGFTKSLAKEVARLGVRVNAVSLGLVRTPSFERHVREDALDRIVRLYPLRRLGEPGDVPPVVLLLASDLCGWVTGQVFAVNGGYAMV